MSADIWTQSKLLMSNVTQLDAEWSGFELFVINPFSPAGKLKVFANNVELDETAYNKPSHQDLHCLSFCFNSWFSPDSKTEKSISGRKSKSTWKQKCFKTPSNTKWTSPSSKMEESNKNYSWTSITWTPMTCFPWLICTHFESLRNSSNSSWKQMFREIFLFYHGILCCVYSLELPHTTYNYCVEIDKIPKLLLFTSWSGTMINPQWLELPIARTNFHGPKDVRAIEVWLIGLHLSGYNKQTQKQLTFKALHKLLQATFSNSFCYFSEK